MASKALQGQGESSKASQVQEESSKAPQGQGENSKAQQGQEKRSMWSFIDFEIRKPFRRGYGKGRIDKLYVTREIKVGS